MVPPSLSLLAGLSSLGSLPLGCSWCSWLLVANTPSPPHRHRHFPTPWPTAAKRWLVCFYDSGNHLVLLAFRWRLPSPSCPHGGLSVTRHHQDDHNLPTAEAIPPNQVNPPSPPPSTPTAMVTFRNFVLAAAVASSAA